MRTQPNRLARRGFTLAELLIVLAIIAILAVISVSAYSRVLRSARERATRGTLDALSNAVNSYYNETRDYPMMRWADLGSGVSTATFPKFAGLDNADQSVATLVYQLQYRSSAGDLLKNLPAGVLVPLNITVTDAGQTRPLYTVRDGWGCPIQYLRPRAPSGAPADYPLLPLKLNNRVLLVSMGRDAKPGQEGLDDEAATTPDIDVWEDKTETPSDKYPDPKELILGKGDDVVVQVGTVK